MAEKEDGKVPEVNIFIDCKLACSGIFFFFGGGHWKGGCRELSQITPFLKRNKTTLVSTNINSVPHCASEFFQSREE